MTKKEKILVPQCLSNLVPLKKGFTLAEVLITLGIIGIVAAMTIPTLVANYQEKSWNTSAQVFERKLTEALRVMNTQQTLAGHTTTQSFVDELAKHFKIVKTCDSNNLKNCVEENITWNIIDISNGGSESETLNLANLKTAADLGKSDWGTETIGVQFANGTTAIMAYDPSCRQDPYSNTVTGMSCISMIYDTSGGKSPNATSKDVRAYNNKIANCAFKSGGTCFSAPTNNYEPHIWNACTGDDDRGTSTDPVDSKFISEYGIDYCITTSYLSNPNATSSDITDYFAAAAELCGGVSKIATSNDIAKIANYLYNTNTIGAETSNGECPFCDKTSISLDSKRAATLGFPTSNSFEIRSGDGAVTGTTLGRWFESDVTTSTMPGRLNSNVYVVCLGE